MTFDYLLMLDSCWKFKLDRGGGKAIHACPDNLEQSGLLCYKKCHGGMEGWGPMCTNSTSWEWRGFGRPLTCAKDEEMQWGFCYKNNCPDIFDGGALHHWVVLMCSFVKLCATMPADIFTRMRGFMHSRRSAMFDLQV